MVGGGGSIPYMYICCICYSKLLGSRNDVSVLSKSVMGLKKVLIGGWVGGVSYILVFGMFLTLQIPFHSMW